MIPVHVIWQYGIKAKAMIMESNKPLERTAVRLHYTFDFVESQGSALLCDILIVDIIVIGSCYKV